jgi:hypothetical protein
MAPVIPASTSGFGLDPSFAVTLAEVLEDCRMAGYEFRVSQGLRTPQVQADYYCKWEKRTPQDIDAAAKKLEAKGAPWVAGLLRERRKIKRQKAWLTSAMPGAGWHQWGLAADCYCFRNGKMVGDGGDPCYAFYAKAAEKRGLRAGLYFSNPDAGHVQQPSEDNASSVYTWSKIDAVMKERFGGKQALHELPSPPSPVSAASLEGVGAGVAAAGLSAAAFFKDDAILASTPLQPARPKQLAGAGASLKRMGQVYNAVGGLIDALGAQVDIDPVAILAVWLVESSGAAFVPGKPILRFEVHKFWKYWGKNNAQAFDRHFRFGGHGAAGASHKNHAFRTSPGSQWKSVHIDSQDREYEALAFAQSLGGRESVCLSSSWGGCQVMGFNHGVLGYASASALAAAFTQDERWHVLGFADFCDANNCLDEVRAKKWVKFGDIYNGAGSVYGPKIEAIWNLRAQFLALPT